MRGLEEIGRYIMNNKVSTLQLNGEDAYNFAHSLVRPSKETIERIKNSHIAIDNIVITLIGTDSVKSIIFFIIIFNELVPIPFL